MSGSLVVVRGTDNGLHYNSFDGGFNWDGWKRVPGEGATMDSPALAHASGYNTLVVRGLVNGVHYTFYS